MFLLITILLICGVFISTSILLDYHYSSFENRILKKRFCEAQRTKKYGSTRI